MTKEIFNKRDMNNKVVIAVMACFGFMMFFGCGKNYHGKLEPVKSETTGKWGFADTLGKIVIAPKWDIVSDFSEGLAAVGLNNKFGYIDEKGKKVIPMIYDTAGDFTDSLALVSVYGEYSNSKAMKNNWGCIDKSGIEVIPIKYDRVERLPTGENYCQLAGKWGIYDSYGKVLLPEIYGEIREFSEGMAAVKSSDKWGFIDNNYNLVIPCEYLEAAYFRDGKADVITNKTTKTQYVRGSAKVQNYDPSGRITSSSSSSNAMLSIEMIYTTYRSIDKTGKVIPGSERVVETPGPRGVNVVK